MNNVAFMCVALVCVLCHRASGQSPSSTPDPAPQTTVTSRSPVQVGGQFFITYRDGRSGGAPFSDFFINRGYINLRAEVLPWLRGRITPDIAVDREGDGEGDLELRLKYCYISADLPAIGFLTAPSVEFGLHGRPWLEFEQKVNLYRVQGPMFLERGDILNSADFGASIQALFGGEMPEEYQKNVSSSYPGRYGSVTVGIFNGGGYHAIEHNLNKSIEGRISLRPLPDIVPGLQFSYAGAFGRGNTQKAVDWRMNVGYLSFEHELVVATGTYFIGTGDSRGRALNPTGEAANIEGWSGFADVRIPGTPVSIFGRYDHFSLPDDVPEWEENTLIVGTAWHIQKKTKLLIDYEVVSDTDGDEVENILKLSAEFGF